MTHVIERADLLAYLRGNRWLAQNGYIPKAHAILCDPPYGLEFMGKEWDRPKPSGLFHVPAEENRIFSNASGHFFDNMRKPLVRFSAGADFEAWVSEWAGLLLDYVHPGAVGLFFGGTRTYHRLAAGLEDAGWEIADCMSWNYASGFPKSLNIEKATGDPKWRGFGSAMKPAWEPCVVCRAPRGKRTYAALARTFGTGALAIDPARIGTDEISNHGGGINVAGRKYGGGQGIPAIERGTYTNIGRFPANFALVCACESDDHDPTCPVAVLGEQSGVSVSTDNPRNNGEFKSVAKGYETPHVTYGHNDTGTAARFFYQAKAASWEREAGLTGFAKRAMRESGAEFGKMTMWNGENGDEAWKAKNPNNPRANIHPTVKPIRLAEYLARLILPPEGDEPRRLLVPFSGSGSEMIGALLAGWDVVTGIEREAEYVELAQARVGWWAQFGTYDEARAAYEQERKAKPAPAPIMVEDEKPAQLALFDGGAA